MSNITTFVFESRIVRTCAAEDGTPLFCGRDVAEALGYRDPNDAIKSICKGPAISRTLPTPGGPQQLRVIAEPDMLRLIVKSTLPAAERFECWVFEEVLPTIRRTGSYGVSAPKSMIEALQLALDQAKQIEAQNAQLEAQRPAVDFVSAYVDDSELTISRRELAKLLRIKERELRALLLSAKVCYPNARGALLPFADQEACGRVGMKPYVNARTGHAGSQLFFSRKGHIHIAARLAESRQIPLLPAGAAKRVKS
jgi:prophage antirepressor-like protein